MYDPVTMCKVMVSELNKICDIKGISRYHLAKAAHVSTSALYSIMKGTTTPNVLTLLMICNALDASVEEVFGMAPPAGKDTHIERINLTEDERQILYDYKCLTKEEQQWVLMILVLLKEYRKGDQENST